MPLFTEHNRNFYDNDCPCWLTELSKDKGISECEDMDALHGATDIFRTSNEIDILEVGCGIGRVMGWISVNLKRARYQGIDISPSNVDYCKDKYVGQSAEFEVLDISDRSPSKKFDLVLWPWAGILELSNLDKILAMKNIRSVCHAESRIFVDFPDEIVVDGKKIEADNQILEQRSSIGFARTQIVSECWFRDMLRREGFHVDRKLSYMTGKGFDRYFLEIGLGVES